MPVRDQHELTDRLDRDIAWRKRELVNLSTMVQRERRHTQAAVLRAAVCLLYAHWEGFMRYAARSYLEYLSNRRLKYGELRRNFLALGLRRQILRASEERRTTAHTELVRTVFQASDERVSSEIVNAIETKGNLGGDVLVDILEAVGFDATSYLTKRALLDDRLLKNRNRIAHGEYLEIDADAYADLNEMIVGLMNRFKNDIENAAATKSYLAHAPEFEALD